MKVSDWLIYEDENIIVLNKPSGLLSIPDREGKEPSLKKLLAEKYGVIFTVHRLDRGTSGLIVFAKNEATHKFLSQQFAPKELAGEEKHIEKIYTGLLMGSLAKQKDRIVAPIAEHPVKRGMMVVHRNGKESLTDYEVLEDFKIYSWVRFRIYTGRTHQIRVHAMHIGHPVVCDELYGDGNPVKLSSLKHKFKLSKNEWEERPLLNRLALHAQSLKFCNTNGETVKPEAPLPKDLKALLQQLRR